MGAMSPQGPFGNGQIYEGKPECALHLKASLELPCLRLQTLTELAVTHMFFLLATYWALVQPYHVGFQTEFCQV